MEEKQIINQISSSLECNLCLNLLCEPITISCGHTFCRICLVKSLRQSKKKCPSCREVCHVSAENAPENVLIKSIAMTISPQMYNQRLVETAAEKESWTTLYPMFYYNDTLFPGSSLHLHLFEPRYRIMMKRVVDSSRSFAYVPNFTNYHANLGDIILIAVIKEVEFMADGRCVLEAILSKRHKIVEHYIEEGTYGLHYCRVEEFHDEEIPTPSLIYGNELHAEAVVLANTIMEGSSNRLAIERRCGAMPNDIQSFSLWLIGITPLSDAEKYALFQSKLTIQRLERGIDGLRVLVTRMNSNAASRLVSLGTSFAATSMAALNRIAEIINRHQSIGIESNNNEVNNHNNNSNNSQNNISNINDGDSSTRVTQVNEINVEINRNTDLSSRSSFIMADDEKVDEN
eukprot:gene8665-11708_t